MSDESKTASSSVTLNLSDPKLWALVAALAGGQFAASKLSISTVENAQTQATVSAVKVEEKQDSIDDRLKDITSMVGEMRYRLEKVEDGVKELQETKKGK